MVTAKNDARPTLGQIIDHSHHLVRLQRAIDWQPLETAIESLYGSDLVEPRPLRAVAGIMVLRRIYRICLFDICAAWIENPYIQFFCGGVTFQHSPPFDFDLFQKWRPPREEEALAELIENAVRAAYRAGAHVPRQWVLGMPLGRYRWESRRCCGLDFLYNRSMGMATDIDS